MASTSSLSAKRIIVVGAGLAGLAAARFLHDRGLDVLVLEARDRLGGRAWTSTKWEDMPIDLGASWIHGTEGNPLSDLADKAHARRLETSYDHSITYDTDGKQLSDVREKQLDRLRSQFHQALQAAQDSDTDTSLRDFLTSWSRQFAADEDAVRLLNFILSSEIEQEYAGSAKRLSTHWHDSAREFKGTDALFAKGFRVIVDFLSKDLQIQQNQVVSRIDWNGNKVDVFTSQAKHSADKVIVTLPLGVLKSRKIQFAPSLPVSTSEAIAKLEMGVLNKCYLRFKELFWPDDVDWLEYIPARHGEWSEWVSFARVAHKPILLGFNAGDRAEEIEGWTDQQVVASAMHTLRKLFGTSIPDPEAFQITRWYSDPYSIGSYSFNPVGAHPQLRRQLAASLNDKLYFAGEATDFNYFGTAHGAYLSGLRAAQEVLD